MQAACTRTRSERSTSTPRAVTWPSPERKRRMRSSACAPGRSRGANSGSTGCRRPGSSRRNIWWAVGPCKLRVTGTKKPSGAEAPLGSIRRAGLALRWLRFVPALAVGQLADHLFGLAGVLLDIALDLLRAIASDVAHGFPDGALDLVAPAFDAFVVHIVLQKTAEVRCGSTIAEAASWTGDRWRKRFSFLDVRETGSGPSLRWRASVQPFPMAMRPDLVI